MTPALFAALTAGCALAIMLVVELQVPLGGVRRFLVSGPHVETEDPVYGPWWVVDERGERVGEGHATPSRAAAQLTAGERVRAWGGELVECPWCAGAYVTAAALALAALHYGADVLWFWPAVWFASALTVVVARAVGNLP